MLLTLTLQSRHYITVQFTYRFNESEYVKCNCSFIQHTVQYLHDITVSVSWYTGLSTGLMIEMPQVWWVWVSCSHTLGNGLPLPFFTVTTVLLMFIQRQRLSISMLLALADIMWSSQIILILVTFAQLVKIHLQGFGYTSPPITVAFEVKPQLEDVVVELTAKSTLVWIFPLTVYNLESNILHTKSTYPQNKYM